MDEVTAPGPVPPELGQEKEEPEQAMEDDIPSDDGEMTREDTAHPSRDGGEPAGHLERE